MTYTPIIWVQVTRAGVLNPAKILCRIDPISPIVIPGLGGQVPYNKYQFYSLNGIPDIAQGDILTDNNGTKYRTSGTNWKYALDHLECELALFTDITP